MPDMREVPLPGGFTNAGRVVRLGDTVRRPRRPTSAATEALLGHLENAGFSGAPRFLGIDDDGRQIVSFVPGEAALEPLPSWALSDDALVSVAELLRCYHDAVASFDGSVLSWPQAVPAAFRGSLVCHNDPNLDNVIFRGGRAVALVDFDLAGPACAAWDVACASRLWAPLRSDGDVPECLRGRSLERLRLFVDSYGLPRGENERVVDAMVDAHDWCYRVVRDAVAAGHEPFARMWQGGGAARAVRTRAWLAANVGEMRAALGV
jgi:hypothetical protein